MKMDMRHLTCLPLFALACQSASIDEGAIVGTSTQALTPPASGVIIEAPSLVMGLSPSTYKDVASSSSNYYVLTNTGIKRVAHGSISTLPTAATFKTIGLDCIDYVNSTWNVVGARSKVGTTRAQLVLKIENATPVTLNLPTDVTTVRDIEAKVYSSSEVEVWITLNISGQSSPVIREFRYNGTSLTTIRTIALDSDAKTGITALNGTYLVGMKANGGYPAFFKKYVSSPFTSVTENQQIEILTHGDPGLYDPSPGITTTIYSHGYDGTRMGALLYPDKIDFAYHNATGNNYVALVPTGTGLYDLVRLPESLVIFNKTPAREFSYWNDDAWVEGSNNCYNYATNRNTMNYAQPGYGGTGSFVYPYFPASLIQAAISDGLEYVADPGPGLFPTVPEGKSLVAMIAGRAPDYTNDYHWYRRDRDGRWTHKPGQCDATDRYFPYSSIDAVVTDPRKREAWDQSQYDTFVGFFLVDSNYVQGMGVENVNGSFDKDIHSGTCDTMLASSFSTGSSADASRTSSVAALEVTIALYSGRPNPVMVVTDEATISAIREAYHQAKTQDGPTPGAKAGRSYMGVTVNNPCGVSGLPSRFRLFDGQMTASNRTRVVGTATTGSSAARAGGSVAREYRSESGTSLESILLDHAAARSVIDAATRLKIRNLNGK